MFRILNKFFNIDIAVSEGLFRLGLGGMEALNQTGVVMSDTHSPSAAARGSLDNHRILQFSGDDQRFLFGFNDSAGTGSDGNSGLAHGFTGTGFVAHGAHLFRSGTDKRDIAAFADFSEMDILGEESVARMDRIDIADFGNADDPVNQQITLIGLRRSDTDGLIGEFHRQTVLVGLGVNENGFNAELLARPDNPECNFAAVCDKHLVKHKKTPV